MAQSEASTSASAAAAAAGATEPDANAKVTAAADAAWTPARVDAAIEDANTTYRKLNFATSEELGRHVTAAEDMSVGSLVFFEFPLVFMVRPEYADVLSRDLMPPEGGADPMTLQRRKWTDGELEKWFHIPAEGNGDDAGMSIFQKVMQYNSFAVVDQVYACHYADALYALGAWFNHSCDANTETVFGKNGALYLRATRSIKAGEQITHRYKGLTMTECTCVRREALRDHLGTTCMCDRCKKEEDECEEVGHVPRDDRVDMFKAGVPAAIAEFEDKIRRNVPYAEQAAAVTLYVAGIKLYNMPQGDPQLRAQHMINCSELCDPLRATALHYLAAKLAGHPRKKQYKLSLLDNLHMAYPWAGTATQFFLFRPSPARS